MLSTESNEAYDAMMAQFTECIRPGDFVEQMLVKDLTVWSWDIIRYTRHKTWGIERKFRQRLELQVQREKMAAQRKEEIAHRSAENADKPATAAEREFNLVHMAGTIAEDVEEILTRPPDELDHARALEDGIEYHERLDKLLNNAIARRNDTLEQLERYRDGLGHRLRRVYDEIIDAKFNDVDENEKPVEAPLIPSKE